VKIQRTLRYTYRRQIDMVIVNESLLVDGHTRPGERIESSGYCGGGGDISVTVDDTESPIRAAERYAADDVIVTLARWVEIDGQGDLLGGGL